MKKVLPILKIILPIVLTVVLLQMVSVPDSYAAPPASGGMYHTVRYGETLFSIGRIYGVNPYSIASVNGLANPDCIYAGQVLYIPSGDGWSGCGRCGCGQPCPPPAPRPSPCRYPGCYPSYGHGYDYTGYYYWNNYPTYRRYSYTCGYYHNCY
ncbi:MAG: LysM peptidoglycan-binding domain-containing protein [Anaerolineae bacterium]|nr:LysM peptidoglycan-binding domain-containing protein [Anaerolineae bacterium]